MPYVTPTSPVGTISSAPFSIIQHSFSPSSINSAMPTTPITPSLPSPSAALMFNYESNTSLDALPSVPRRKSNFRPKMVTPQASYSRGASSEPASAGLDKLFHAPPPPAASTITVQPPTPDKRVQDEQASLANAKRVRGARMTTFTTVVAASDSQSQSEDEDDDVPEPQQPPQRRGCVASPMGEGGINMSAMGRKRGEMMRHAVSMDASSYTSLNPSISSNPVSPALAHAATVAPAMMITNATPLSSAVTSPVSPYPPMDSAASRPLAARKFHQAIVAGQGNVLRLNMDAIKRARSASPTAPAPASASAAAPPCAGTSSSFFLSPASAVSAYDGRPKFNTVGPLSAQFVRKKSGELVKPALRTSRTYCPGDSSPIDSTPSSSQMLMYRRNSAPTTPTPKNVHFDSQLEHVKLFLAEQKPAANLAYDKRVAARFTMDWWQTTSEVVAKYAESVSAPPPHASSLDTTHDRFVFQVKLADVLSKIEEKTMFVAVRYNVAGQEMWDNNCGGNYEVKFERVKGPSPTKQQQSQQQARFGSPTKGTSPTREWGVPVKPAAAASRRDWSPTKERRGDWSPTKERREWSPTKNSVELQMADLRKELERAVFEDDGEVRGAAIRGPVFRRDRDAAGVYATPAPARKVKTLSLPLPASNQSSPSMSPHPTLPSPSSNPPTLSAQLSTRYDLTAALNRKGADSWNPSKALQDAASWNPPPLPSSEIKFNLARSGRKASGTGAIPFPSRGGSSSPEDQQKDIPTREASLPGTFPAAGKPLKNVAMALGSPRDRDDVFFDQALPTPDEKSTGAGPTGSFGRGRNHRRGSSYFDGWMESVKMTPPGTPKDVWQPEEPQQPTMEDAADMKDEEEVAASLKSSTSVGSISGLAVESGPDAAATEDELTEKEQEKEALDILEATNGGQTIAPSTSANDFASAPALPSPKDALMRFNSFPQPSQQSATLFAPRPQMPSAAYAVSAPLAAPESGESCMLSPLGDSIASTPSATSASSPSQSPSSPSQSLPTSPSNEMDIASLIRAGRNRSMIDSQDYNFFLNRFCFFTGDLTGAASTGDHAAVPRRIHSESDVDSYFAHMNPPHPGAGNMYYHASHNGYSPWEVTPRCNSEAASGAATPTAHSPEKGITTPRPNTPTTIRGSATTTPVL
ncbi:hypothetical protein FS837_002881 [Tulasnella sp. UAMH 9824]|nr:hypothetical protein FS837_002881 [Tulasnella sp. UAMH 9824]